MNKSLDIVCRESFEMGRRIGEKIHKTQNRTSTFLEMRCHGIDYENAITISKIPEERAICITGKDNVNIYIRKAFICLEHAEIDFININVDDAYLDSCCFNLQQSMEFLLNGIVEMCGLKCALNHEIGANLSILDEAKIEIPYKQDIEDIVNLLDSWKTDGRCNDPFIELMGNIEDVMKYVNALIKYTLGSQKQIMGNHCL